MITDVKYTHHAVDEMRAELAKVEGVNASEITYSSVTSAIKDYVSKATYISEIMNAKGKIDRLYAFRRFAFVLDRYDDVVITVYKRENTHEDLRSLVTEMLFEKMREYEAFEKELVAERLETDIRLQLHKKFNERVGATVYTHMKELEAWDELKLLDQKLHEFRLEKSKIAKGIAAYI